MNNVFDDPGDTPRWVVYLLLALTILFGIYAAGVTGR
jgi:hypothetical protein